jgi:hypothetical protein
MKIYVGIIIAVASNNGDVYLTTDNSSGNNSYKGFYLYDRLTFTFSLSYREQLPRDRIRKIIM